MSRSLNMLYCDTKDLIEYELIDKKTLEKVSTKTYLKQAEQKVIKHLASFENVVVSISFDYLIHNYKILKDGSLIVFLKLTKKFVQTNASAVEAISYEMRSEKLEKNSTVTIAIKKTDEKFVCEKIISALGGIL